jgi:hypothetical protein
MAEMNADEIRGACECHKCMPLNSPKGYDGKTCAEWKAAKLAALPPQPEPLHKAFDVQITAFEWIVKCQCGWGKRVFGRIDAAKAECDMHDIENNAPHPQPDLRAALVEARAALENALKWVPEYMVNGEHPYRIQGVAALARIDAVLEVKP